ncbi:MAG: two-component system response regulator CreB [Deltaproteobacteria bacterium]|nr:two-component system response regulator CreB [Deltaproteobacteria bacterium]
MKKRILLVEDEPSVADNITYALTTEGFTPEWCQTGAAAQTVLATEEVALVILDVGLPDMNGFELAKTIRQHSDVPIIFVTARAEEVDRIVGLEIGADDYMVKPFSPRELTARVKAILRRTDRQQSGNPGNPSPRPSSPFHVDEARHLISYHGVALSLSRYEFRLCSLFVKHPGHVYSREQLLQLLWASPEMSLDRTVDTHIKTLRQKLKAIRPDQDPIVTHRGVGYALKEEL